MRYRIIFILAFLVFITEFTLSQRIAETFRHFLGFTLDEDSLSAVQSKFGCGKIIEKGDAGGYEASISYYIKKQNIIISFISTELGGGKYIEGYHLFKISPDSNINYPKITLSQFDTLNIGGLYIGMPLTKFKNIIGEKNIVIEYNRFSFEYYGKEKIPESKYPNIDYDVMVSGEGLFEEGILSELNIWIARTN